VSASSKQGDAGLPAELAQLPHGRHGLPPEFVARNQRQRLIASLTAVIGERGYPEATIAAITSGAGVSSRTFYKYFETVEECYLAAFEQATEDLRGPLAEAFSAERSWPAGIGAGLDVVLEEFTAFPDLARLLTADPFVAGPEIAARHKAAIEELVPYLRRGRELSKAAAALPETTEKGLLGGVSSRIGRLTIQDEGEVDFTALAPDLLQFLLTPYLGAKQARQHADRRR
jgi:AcrR family transcriptional regulator